MKTVGVIVEYNPFHNGHAYHLAQAKIAAQANTTVAVMSGNFLQRGEPALVNKWARTEMALGAGVDVVIELPAAFAIQPAEWFAYGAVSAFHASGVIDALCFGSETSTLEELLPLAQLLSNEDDVFKQALQKYLKTGLNYPHAYHNAVKDRTGSTVDLSQPNTNLGLHYLIALQKLNSHIQPLTIQRIKSAYHQTALTDERIASATAIRTRIMESSTNMQAIAAFIPDTTKRILHREFNKGRAPMDWEQFAKPLYHQILSRSLLELASIAEVTEGLEHRLKRAVYQPNLQQPLTVSNLLKSLKTRRYTMTKLQRMLCRILLNDTKHSLQPSILTKGVQYLRVLGFSKRGRQLLKKMKQNAAVPIITQVNKQNAALLEADIRAASLYALAYPSPATQDLYQEFRQPPVQVD